jgi:hypothetical protein
VLRRQFASAAEAVRECCGGSSRVLRRQFASAAEARVPRRRECRGGASAAEETVSHSLLCCVRLGFGSKGGASESK